MFERNRLAAPAGAFVLVLLALPALAGTTIDLSAEAARPAANDQVRATVFAEASGATPAELARRVNAQIADSLALARGYGSVRTQSGGTHTYPVYTKGNRIESWRMRSELTLESGDAAAMAELLGKLQGSLAVGNVAMLPSPETRRKAENEAMTEALAAFRARAKLLADAMGKPYRIKHLSVGTSGQMPVPKFRAAAMSMAAEASPMPMEGGESQVSANVSGQIELAD